MALKFLPHEMVVSDVDKERLLREARSASALDHPNIGVIYGIEESDDQQLFIIMAYYEGDTLAQRLNRGVLSLRESLDLAMQIARGLSAAHARNIIHRDIKPSNIIITKDNVAKIVDFGLARVVASASATQSISLTGTLPYMAPEQILGELIDQRSDIWALGRHPGADDYREPPVCATEYRSHDVRHPESAAGCAGRGASRGPAPGVQGAIEKTGAPARQRRRPVEGSGIGQSGDHFDAGSARGAYSHARCERA